MIETRPTSIPWWRSRVIVGAIISALFKLVFAVLTLFGHDLGWTDQDIQPVVDAVVLLISLVGDVIATHARVVQKAAPVITAKGKVV